MLDEFKMIVKNKKRAKTLFYLDILSTINNN